MTVGIRITGNAGQIQIDADHPMFVVKETGAITPADWTNNGQGGQYSNPTFKYFVTPVTTVEPPLVFLRFTSPEMIMSNFTIIGGPGNWLGFAAHGGILNRNANGTTPVAFYADWFICGSIPGSSGNKVGIRIRNPSTGAVTYDSGFKVVKFLQQSPAFIFEGRIVRGLNLYSVSMPAGAYFMANHMTGWCGTAASDGGELWPGVSAPYANKMLMYLYGSSSDAGVPYRDFMWSALFAIPGV
jgi:hypothetical protein